MRRIVVMMGAVLCLSLAFCATASADTTVAANQNVVEATVIGESLTLNGTSDGSVIVIDGNLTLGPKAQALDGVTVIGGHISTAPGAVVHGDVFQFGAALPHPSAWEVGAVLLMLIALRLAVVWFIWRVAVVLARSAGAQRMFEGARERPIRAVLVGALLTAGLSAAAVLLALTVLGAPLALAVVGVILSCAALGCAFALRLAGLSPSDRRMIFVILAVPVVGDAAIALATIVGAGALFHHLVAHRDASHPRGAYP